MIKTPILQTEHIRLLEQHVNFLLQEATDYVRAGAHEDGGITGAMKIAHASEGFGLDVELHGPGPVHRHVMSSIRNTNYYELGLDPPQRQVERDTPFTLTTTTTSTVSTAKATCLRLWDRGIGVPIDWDWIKAHQTGPRGHGQSVTHTSTSSPTHCPSSPTPMPVIPDSDRGPNPTPSYRRRPVPRGAARLRPETLVTAKTRGLRPQDS